MLITTEIIAKKYALAFLRASKDNLPQALLEKIRQLGALLENRKIITTRLAIPTLSDAIKSSFIKKIADHFGLNAPFEKLLFLLIEHKRITLLPVIIKHIINECNKRDSLGIFAVRSSHPLQEQEKQRIINFITHTAPYKKIQATFTVNPHLISGIRIQSDTLLWERSINRLLKRAAQCTFQRAGL